jgi:hypothetical protein
MQMVEESYSGSKGQYDSVEGTIGELKLVKRWVIVNEYGDIVTPRQARCTFESRKEAESKIDAYWADNPKERVHQLLGKELFPQQWWCYPNSRDPISPVKTNED